MSAPSAAPRPGLALWPYFLAGTWFGFVIVKAEAVSWFRIQEMFRFQSFHMYGTIMSAVVVGMVSIQMLRRTGARTASGQPIVVEGKPFTKGTIIGGVVFGFGWALTGACPGPLYALVGGGVPVMAVSLLAAVAGTWTYGLVRDRLPH